MKLSKHEIGHKSLEGKGHGIILKGYSLEERFSTYGSRPPQMAVGKHRYLHYDLTVVKLQA